MIRYVIIDDEPIAHDIIKGYCDLLPNYQLAAQCYDAIEALEYLNKHSVDLLFLDLNMPKLKGFDFLKTLNNPPKVIVTTAYKEFALEGFELNVVDYLLKPFSFERFVKAVQKIEQKSTTASQPSVPLTNEQKSLFIKTQKKHIQIRLEDILFAEAQGNYTRIVTRDDTLEFREKISDFIKQLPPTSFFQVHKSFIVAKAHIKAIEGNRILIEDYTIPIGKLYKHQVNELLL